MKKRVGILFLAIILVLGLMVGCKKKPIEKEPDIIDEEVIVGREEEKDNEKDNEKDEEKSDEQKELEEKYQDTDDINSMDVSIDFDEEIVVKELRVAEDEVLIKLPLETQGAYSQRGLDRLILEDEKLLDGTLNEDRSITVKMKKEEQQQLAESMLEGLKTTVVGLSEDKESYPYIEKSEINEEVTSIKITISGEYEEESLDRLAFELGLPSVSYKSYALKDMNVVVSFIENGEVILEYKYPEQLPKPIIEKPEEIEMTDEELDAVKEKEKLEMTEDELDAAEQKEKLEEESNKENN